MNCQNFESIVNDLVRGQIMEANAREQALLHSTSCASCSLRLQEEQALTEGLRELNVLMGNAVASDSVGESVALAFRSYHAASGAGKIAPAVVGLGRSKRRYWNYAAAAGILLAVALGVAANRFWRPESSGGPVANSREIAAPQKLAGPENIATNPGAEDITPGPLDKLSLSGITSRPAKHRATSRYRVAKNTVTVQSLSIMAPDAEITTDFIAIAYSNASNVSEGGQVVRLELPRYAMARFGVPMNEERYDERVKADVWVGADGLARAIRFVQ